MEFPLNMKAIHFGDRGDQKVTAVSLSHTNIYIHRQQAYSLARRLGHTTNGNKCRVSIEHEGGLFWG